MCLRRFPWKAPRMSDNSYRLFVSPPDPGQQAMLDHQRKSSGTASRPGSNAGISGDEHRSMPNSRPSSRPGSAHGHHQDNSEVPRSASTTPATTGPADVSSSASSATIKGPLRLLRLLPRDTRHIIGRMLELDPRKRATLDEILEDPWVQNALVCRQEEGGQCFPAPNHTHTLEGGGATLAAPKK